MSFRRASMLILPLWAGGLCGQSALPSAGVDAWIAEAFANNRELLAVQQRVEEARGQLRQAGVRPTPSIEASAASGKPLKTPGEEEYNVGYFLPIETGGKRAKRLSVAERGIELAEAELADRRRRLTFDIKTQYIEAAANRRKADAIARMVEVNRESFRLIDARVQRDDAAPLERGLAMVELNRAQAQQMTALGQAETAELELRRTAGLTVSDASSTVSLAKAAPVLLSSEELAASAMNLRADLKAARTLQEQAAAEIELARAQGRSDVTLSAQYTWRTGQFDDPLRITSSGDPLVLIDRDNVLTVGVSIPLQKQKRNLGNIEAAIARQRAARLRAEHLERTIPLEIAAVLRRYQAAQQATETLSTGVLEQSNRNLAVIRQAYNLGQLRLLDVLNEQRRLLETELTFIDAEAELARSRAELERAVGGDLR